MTASELRTLTVDQLVARFVSIALEQDDALLDDDFARFNTLFDRMEAIEQELKVRDGDQRRALLFLYEHPNAQVRLKAATATLAVEPDSAHRMLQIIADSREFPQAGDAGMTLVNLDRGIFRPE